MQSCVGARGLGIRQVFVLKPWTKQLGSRRRPDGRCGNDSVLEGAQVRSRVARAICRRGWKRTGGEESIATTETLPKGVESGMGGPEIVESEARDCDESSGRWCCTALHKTLLGWNDGSLSLIQENAVGYDERRCPSPLETRWLFEWRRGIDGLWLSWLDESLSSRRRYVSVQGIATANRSVKGQWLRMVGVQDILTRGEVVDGGQVSLKLRADDDPFVKLAGPSSGWRSRHESGLDQETCPMWAGAAGAP